MPISIRLLMPAAMAALLSACAMGERNFNCPGMPEGAICKTPQEVYRLTNNADHVAPDGASTGNTVQASTNAAAAALVPRKLMEPITQPQPILEPAVTMRAWIAPWIDKRGDLHFPSLLFTEVTPRRWSIGEVVGRDARVLVPMAVEGSSSGPGALDRYGQGDEQAPARNNGPLPGVPSLPSPLPPQ